MGAAERIHAKRFARGSDEVIVTGHQDCAGSQKRWLIHVNYEVWIDPRNSTIVSEFRRRFALCEEGDS